MRYNRYLIILMLFLIAISGLSQTIPWKTKSRLGMRILPRGAYEISPLDPGKVVAPFYRNGIRPRLVVYSSEMDSSGIFLYPHLTYEPTAHNHFTEEDTFWWADILTSGDIAPLFVVKRHHVGTTDTTTYSYPNPHPNHKIVQPYINIWEPAQPDSGSWMDTVTVRASNLPDITIGEMYQYWMEPTVSTLPWKVETDTIAVLFKHHDSPADTLFWMYRNWEDARQHPALFNRMAGHFPTDTRLARELFWRYYEDVNCDSVTFYGNRLKEIWQNQQSQYVADFMSWFDVDKAMQDVDDRIHDICVEGQTQPITPLGR